MRASLSEMPEPVEAQPRSDIEATYKARELEGIVDLYFYRRIGFRLAQFFARLQFTPAAVTLIGGVVGIVAGHLYFYADFGTNMLGMALHIFANALDNADGQLARLTNQKSRTGRILDSFVDHLVFASIYIHLALRCQAGGASASIWILVIAAALSHALQAAAADYCRNAYLYFAKGQTDFDSAETLQKDFREMKWSREPWSTFLLALYLNITREQEMLTPGLSQLRAAGNPDWLSARYAAAVRPSFKWWSVLMTNSRMLCLFVVFLIGQPVWFFWIEVTLFNVLLVVLLLRQEKIARSLVDLVAHSRGSN